MKELEFGQVISKKLSVLIALQLGELPEKSDMATKVHLLSTFNLTNAEIAEILGTSKGTIEVTKSRNIKRRKGSVHEKR